MQATIAISMKTQDFNAEAAPAQYGYRASPVNARAFQIVRLDETGGDPSVVGDYTILDSHEDVLFAEKKVINLISLLNGRKTLVQLGHETGMRVLYHLVTDCDDDGMARVVFYTLGKEGVSVENALFRVEKDIYHGS